MSKLSMVLIALVAILGGVVFWEVTRTAVVPASSAASAYVPGVPVGPPANVAPSTNPVLDAIEGGGLVGVAIVLIGIVFGGLALVMPYFVYRIYMDAHTIVIELQGIRSALSKTRA